MASPGGSPKNGDGDAAMKSGDATMKSEDAAAGEKRKRAVEPDGGPHVGQRGDETRAPPMVAASSTSSNKKARTDGE
ncbi:hypothetical protein BD626DRAFT_495308 [Schizophyllum amplum]|uniref:Uncharacterized protein n=1 Tax=Schizophyllum amplum TaxID=97359 RepID=A0A550CE34_9AGAR|nr:hypothetical protein BD626DRAFT_525784 [Auriculariopsis ampla]TRM63058.1 hypothetical protein BD626DRAFT_495308 [Auriculariopsis ampla]